MKSMGLQARGTAGVDSASTGGTWDISNADRLGKSEVELVNIFIEGVAKVGTAGLVLVATHWLGVGAIPAYMSAYLRHRHQPYRSHHAHRLHPSHPSQLAPRAPSDRHSAHHTAPPRVQRPSASAGRWPSSAARTSTRKCGSTNRALMCDV